MKNIFDYYTEALGVAPDDATLRDLPVDSVCGAECKGVIDAARSFLHYADMAYGYDLGDKTTVIAQTYEIVEIFWRG